MVEHDVPGHARRIGDYLRRQLGALKERHPGVITEVRGLGLLNAVVFSDTLAPRLVAACNEEGLLLNPVRPNALRLMPPLIIEEADVDEAIEKLERGLTKVLEG
jgi:acetylornithine/succinyldiaminopimelate/putrescine aminotransferase